MSHSLVSPALFILIISVVLSSCAGKTTPSSPDKKTGKIAETGISLPTDTRPNNNGKKPRFSHKSIKISTTRQSARFSVTVEKNMFFDENTSSNPTFIAQLNVFGKNFTTPATLTAGVIRSEFLIAAAPDEVDELVLDFSLALQETPAEKLLSERHTAKKPAVMDKKIELTKKLPGYMDYLITWKMKNSSATITYSCLAETFTAAIPVQNDNLSVGKATPSFEIAGNGVASGHQELRLRLLDVYESAIQLISLPAFTVKLQTTVLCGPFQNRIAFSEHVAPTSIL